MRTSSRNHPQQIHSSDHDLTLVGLLSLDLPAIVSLILVLGAVIPAALVLTLGYLPVGFFNAVFGRDNMDSLVFEGPEIPLLVAGAGTVTFPPDSAFHHYRSWEDQGPKLHSAGIQR